MSRGRSGSGAEVSVILLESPRLGDSNTHPQHMILWRNIEYHFCLQNFGFVKWTAECSLNYN